MKTFQFTSICLTIAPCRGKCKERTTIALDSFIRNVNSIFISNVALLDTYSTFTYLYNCICSTIIKLGRNLNESNATDYEINNLVIKEK